MTKRILVPLDGTQNAEQALRLINDLAILEEIELFLLNVVNDDTVPYPAYFGGFEPHIDVELRTEYKNSEAYVKNVELREKSIISEVTGIVSDGEPADVILKTAEEEEIDLIVMVTHGYGFLERLLVGSVTEQVVRHANCPVFAIRDGHMPKHFLIALDGTPYSENILPLVFELAALFRAKVTLTTIRRPRDITTMADMGEVAKFDRKLAENLLSIEHGRPGHYLDKIRENYLKKYDIEIDYDVDVGDPGRTIVRTAERHACDVIAMVTHGRQGLDWLMQGSVTERVMHNTDAAMFILHKEEESD